ncbi:MAG TPA: histidine kinase [Polyangiaceae bacterium]|nr:histidine kinase [Polyangiaceae bacterium]
MHPLLAQRRSLFAYLAFWAGLAVVPGVLVRSATPFGAFTLALGTTLLFAVVSLPTYYLCRALPLTPGRTLRVLGAHAAAGAAWATLFLLLALAFVPPVALVPGWHGLAQEVDQAESALLGVGILFYLLVASFHYVLAELDQHREAVEREGAMALLAQRAELYALRARVHPHFLFNSLNTVNALIGYDTEKAREACLLLAEYLRGTLKAQERALVPLSDEWSLSERYLKVEALRMGERLRVDVELEDTARACLVPSLLLQPLVENAVTHGIALVQEPAPLQIRARRAAERLTIELTNGVDPAPRKHDGGVGLANVRARLAAQYGGDALVRVERDATRFRVILDLPARAPGPMETA